MSFGYSTALITEIEKDIQAWQRLRQRFKDKWNSVPDNLKHQLTHDVMRRLYRESKQDYSDYMHHARIMGFSPQISQPYKQHRQKRAFKLHEQARDYINHLLAFDPYLEANLVQWEEKNIPLRHYYAYLEHLSQ